MDGEVFWRMSVFIGLFVVLAIVERLLPRRDARPERNKRWFTNWAIVVVDSLTLRVIFPAAAVGTALYAQTQGWGLFNVFDVNPWVAGIVSFVILDFSIWFAHVVSHKVPLLWRVHGMHHSDVDLDVSSALRFHPIEIVLSMLWKAVVVIALGAPAIAVLVFEIVLNGGAMFNHANINIPQKVDRWLRWIIVTPDMHRIHHSIEQRETDSNYGFNLPWWDRLFGTYIAEPKAGQEGMTIGLASYQDDKPAKLGWTLLFPFMKRKNATE